jgi:hypothetical protein
MTRDCPHGDEGEVKAAWLEKPVRKTPASSHARRQANGLPLLAIYPRNS